MSDEVASKGRDTQRAAQSGAEGQPAEVDADALEALRNIVFGTRLEALDELRERVERAESLRSLLEKLEARSEHAEVATATALAERAAAAQALAERLEAAEAYARQVEADASKALAAREAADEALAQRLDRAEAVAERVEGPGGLGERVDEVERLADRVEEVERVARRVEGLEELDRRVTVVEEVRERVIDEDLRVEDVSAVLPRAVVVRGRQDGQLAASLRPTIEDTLMASARKNPQALVDVIFPVLGPAIRKMILTAVTATVGSINRAVESSFTIRGLKWRLQAWRTKRSYAEIALMHGLVYRVEQLFLIQRDSGLLLAHAVMDPADAEEPEAVSGMLTAITDFVRDSFKVESGSEVETFRVGDLTLIVKGGPKAVLAATVRGVAPPDVHDGLSTTIEQVHRDYGQAIDEFDGDMESLAGVEALLEPNLVQEQKERKKRGPGQLIFWVLVTVLAATLVTNLVVNSMRASRVESDVRALARSLGAEAGIVITGVHEEGDGWVIEGLRDPLAADPAGLLAKSPVDEGDVTLRIGAYRSLESEFVRRRLATQFPVPETVAATLEGRTLVLRGRAVPGWIELAREKVNAIEGIDGIDVAELVTDPALMTLMRQRGRLVLAAALLAGTDDALADDTINQVRDTLVEARKTAGSTYTVKLVVIALVRRTEDEPAARARAARLMERLQRAGAESTLRFRGPAELARPAPGEILPAGDEPEIRLDLDIRLAKDGD